MDSELDSESAHAKTTHQWLITVDVPDGCTTHWFQEVKKISDQCRPHTYVQYLQSLTPAASSTTLCQQFTALKGTSVFIYEAFW